MCSLQIVTEQEICLTKHNGGTRALLTLLGSISLPAMGVKSHPEREKITEKRGCDRLQREEQTVLNSSPKNYFLPSVVCVLVCMLQDQENKQKRLSVQCCKQMGLESSPVSFISFMTLNKTLTFFKIQFLISQIDMLISAMKIKR